MAETDEILWQDEYSVENKEIDEQHKALIRMTNELYAGCRQGGITEKLTFMKTIQGAVSYAKTHFAAEETLMRQTAYPGYGDHKREHEDFVAEVMRQVKDFEGDGQFHPENFAQFLSGWILKHIAGADKLYIPYLRDK